MSSIPLTILVTALRGAVKDEHATNGLSWEHTSEPVEGEGIHTICGPYVNDFGKPGFYKVRFRICGVGFQHHETPVVVLDIIHRPAFLREDNLVLLGQRVVRDKELSPKYKDFDIYCYVAGIGNYEYRCLVISDSHIQGKQLRFDTIKVYVHVPTSELF